MPSDTVLTAAFEDLLQTEVAEELLHHRYCRALSDQWERNHDYLWAAQQEEANRRYKPPWK